MGRKLFITFAVCLLAAPVMAQSIDNIVGNLSIVSPPESAPVSNSPGNWSPIPGLSTLVQSRAGDNLEITVSAEIYTTSSVWLVATVDSNTIEPDVVFKRGGTFWDGVRSFTFVKPNVTAGTHTVEIKWYTNAGTTAQIRDRSLSVSSASPTWGEGRLAVAVPAGGPDLVKSTASWENIPGLSATITTENTRNLKITFSGEVSPGTGRFFARALVDGNYVSDVLFDAGAAENGGTRSFTFVRNTIGAGTHVVTIQWLAEGGQIRLGDRTLAVNASRTVTAGGGLVVRGFELAPTGFSSTEWVDIANTIQSFSTTDASANLQLTFAGEARTSGGRLFLRALLDDRPASPGDITYVGAGSTFRAQSYSFVLKNVLPGWHTVKFQAAVDAGAYGEIGDRSVTVLFKRRAGADFAQPYASLTPKRRSGPPVVVIGFDPHRKNTPAPTLQQLQNWVRGDDRGPSVRGWYLENTLGRYAPSQFTFLGWYDAPAAKQGTWYWDTSNWALMAKDAVIAADADFNFRQFDTNGDGYVTASELAVIVVRPQDEPSGTFQRAWVNATIDGVTLAMDIHDLYLSANEANRTWNVGTLSHELAHGILGTEDMYVSSAARPGFYSIMDSHSGLTHLDPFDKLKSGFLNPEAVEINSLGTTTVSLTGVEQKGAATIVYSPSKNDQEYFIVENRSGTTAAVRNYDGNLPAFGVVVWHIVEDVDLMNQFPPAGVDPSGWGRSPAAWARLGVRKIAVLSGAGDRVDLKWADGSSTGVRVTARDAAQETVNVDIAKF